MPRTSTTARNASGNARASRVMHDVSSFCNTRLSRGIQLALLLLLQTRAFLRLDCRTMQGGFNTLPQ